MTNESGTATGDATLTDVISGYEKQGFTGQFGARPGKQIQCFTCREAFPAGEAAFEALSRLEGASDPADMAAVGAVVCPRCGARGTIVLKYGPDSTPEEADALLVLENHRGASGVQPGAAS